MSDTQSPSRRAAIGRAALNLLLASLDIYALGLIAILVWRWILPQFWVVALISNLLHWLLLPSAVILIMLLVMHRWRRAALWALPALGFVILFGGLFLPRVPSARACADECKPLRVMTYNVLGHPLENRDAQVAVLRASGADIIALQEVSDDAADAFNRELAELYPHRVFFPNSIYGTGLMSKYPIENPQMFQVPPGTLYQIAATVRFDGELITVISAHPSPPGVGGGGYTPRGHDEIARVVELASGGGPALLMGDFNLSDQAPDYSLMIDAGLHDAFREVGWGFGTTWPNRLNNWDLEPFPALVRIDYIFYSEEFDAVSAWVGPFVLSDHRPVSADLIYGP